MKRDWLLVLFPLFLIIGGFVLEVINFALRIAFGTSDTPAFYFSMSLMLIGLAVLVVASPLKRQAARIDQLERRLAECESQQEALRESLRARAAKSEGGLDATQADMPVQPKP